MLDDKLEAEFDALMAIGHLTSRQEARLSAVMRERLELIERRQRRRVARKSKKRRKKKKLPRSGLTRRRPRQWRGRYAGPDVPHHGRYGPGLLFRGSDVAVLHQGHQHLCCGAEAHSHGLAAQQIMVIPQCLFDKVVDVLVVQMQKTGDFTGAVLGQVGRLARCCARQGVWSRQNRNPWSSRSCSSWTRLWARLLWCMTGVLVQTVQKSVEIPQLQFLDKVMDVPVCVHVGTDSAEYCGFSTGACTGQVMDMPVRVHVGPDSSGCRRHLARGAEAVMLMRIRLMGRDCACLSVVPVLMRIRLMSKDCACLSVVLVLMRIRLMGKDCACLSVVLVLVCSVLDMLYGHGDVGKVCAFVLRGQGC